MIGSDGPKRFGRRVEGFRSNNECELWGNVVDHRLPITAGAMHSRNALKPSRGVSYEFVLGPTCLAVYAGHAPTEAGERVRSRRKTPLP
jgi:hypothetical protein